MAFTELVLVRHGESEDNRDRRFGGHSPTPLTELGRRQAEAAATAIAAGRSIDAIYVSDLARAVETAAPLARRTNLQPTVTRELRERSVGVLTGLTFAEAEARHPEVWAALLRSEMEYVPPEGESHRMCSRRVGEFVERLFPRHEGQRVVLVSHGVAIDHMLRHFLCVAEAPELRFLLHADNASIHRVQRREASTDRLWRIVSLNDVAHLATIGTTVDPRASA